MKPYYQDDLVTLYHGDSFELFPALEGEWTALVMDPPYGIGYDSTRHRKSTEAGRKRGNWHSVHWSVMVGDWHDFDPRLFTESAWPQIVWGAVNFSQYLYPSNGWLFWDKQRAEGFAGGDGELAWTNFLGSTKRFSYLWDGFRRAGEHGEHYHPTQKPLALMRWCLGFLPPGSVVIDPFSGSGTLLVAAKQLGIKCIGIEIEKDYCEAAVKRLSQEVLDLGGAA